MGWVWTRGQHRVSVDVGAIVLLGPTGEQRGDLHVLATSIRNDVGLDVLAEVTAVVEHPDPFRAPLPEPGAVRDRPRVRRSFGTTGRGRVGPSASIHAGRVTLRLHDGERIDTTLEALADNGLPPAARQALGASESEALIHAARTLAALPCECGTGHEARGSWRHLHRLTSVREPRAPIEVNSTVSRCAVCDRVWTVDESGDSHYSWSYRVQPFSGVWG